MSSRIFPFSIKKKAPAGPDGIRYLLPDDRIVKKISDKAMNVNRRTGERQALPSGWRWAKLGEACEIIAGQSPPGHTYRKSPEGLPFFQGKADFGSRNPIPRAWCVEPTKVARAKDILISIRAPVGPINLANQECCIGRGLAAIRCGNNIEMEFLFFWLKKEEKSLERKSSGSAFGAINRGELEEFAVPLPPLAEQKRIAGILNQQMEAIEKARAAAAAQLQAANGLPATYLRQAFPTPGQALPPDRRWEKLGEVCEIQLGKMLSPISKQGKDPSPHLRNANVQWNRIDTSNLSYMDFSPVEQKKFCLKKGDLLVCEGGEPGRSAVWDGRIDPCYYQKALHRLRPINSIVNPYFVMFRLWSGVQGNEIVSANAKTTIAHIPAVRLKKLVIALPPLSEQKRIVNRLNDKIASAERLRVGLEMQLHEINALPAALLRRAFNGEL